MKVYNGIQYKEYSVLGAKDYSALARIKVNPYVVSVFCRLLKEKNRETIVAASSLENGEIRFDVIDISYAKNACDKVSKLTDIKYEFMKIED